MIKRPGSSGEEKIALEDVEVRRTFESLGYRVTHLHRTQFGNYHLVALPAGGYEPLTAPK